MTPIVRREFLQHVVAGTSVALGGTRTTGAATTTTVPDQLGHADSSAPDGGSWGPDPLFEKPAPITVAALAQRPIQDIVAVEVTDYAPGHFTGALSPSPPHADMNPKKAIIVAWKDRPHRLVFSHETSYDPYIELPNGVGYCNQFFEGNGGGAELFNNNGRKEHNSFIDIIHSGPHHVWVRWNYFCVNAGEGDDAHPALRGTEDYIAYPNGLIWRRLTYTTMMPNDPSGYSWQPIDIFALAPNGTTWKDLFPKDAQHGDYHVGALLDAYSDKRYDKYWDDAGTPRRTGDAQLLLDISHSRGFAVAMPFIAGNTFTVIGAASGIPSEKSQIVDHSFSDSGGWNWGATRWDHWPIGWINSETNNYVPGTSPYPYSFGPFSHYIVNKPVGKVGGGDYNTEVQDMDLNRWSERHVYYTLTGVGQDLESIRHVARQWLDKGAACAQPQSIADLRWPVP